MSISAGAEVVDPVYDHGLNDSGDTIGAFLIVSGGQSSISIAAGESTIPFGVVARDAPDGAQADVYKGGSVPVIAGTAGMTEGTLVMPEAGGTGFGVDVSGSAGDNKGVLGLCTKTASSGKLGQVRIQISQTQIAD